MNLNNTPSAGPLRAEELIPWRRNGASAGVQPEPAEAATDVGHDDGLNAARGIVYCIPAALLAWGVIVAVAVTWKFWPF